jgi:hypothetical protein
VGSYEKLTDYNGFRAFFDGREAHHIIPDRTLERFGLSTREAPCIMLTEQQHRLTISDRGRIYGPFRNLREEIEANINNIIDILRADGTYTLEIENNLRETMRLFEQRHAELFI